MKQYSFTTMSQREFHQALKAGDPNLFEDLIQFLEDDPFEFRTGYKKERFWKYVTRTELSSRQVARLEKAALQYLDRPPSREFRTMCVTMTRIATDDFWHIVSQNLNAASTVRRLSAACLYAYSAGIQAGSDNIDRMWPLRFYAPRKPRPQSQDIEVLRQWLKLIHTPPEMQTEDDLLEIMKSRFLWPHGEVIYTEPDPADFPIISPLHRVYDKKFGGFALKQSEHRAVLDVVNGILGTSFIVIFKDTTWICALYFLYYLEDARAVAIVKRFLETYDFYGLHSSYHDTLMHACSKILRFYNTPEAKAILAQSDAIQQMMQKHNDIPQGWLRT